MCLPGFWHACHTTTEAHSVQNRVAKVNIEERDSGRHAPAILHWRVQNVACALMYLASEEGQEVLTSLSS